MQYQILDGTREYLDAPRKQLLELCPGDGNQELLCIIDHETHQNVLLHDVGDQGAFGSRWMFQVNICAHDYENFYLPPVHLTPARLGSELGTLVE